MYDDIRKPLLLKDIPMIFIRSLPAIYYFNKFAGSTIPEKAKLLFVSNIDFLSEAVNITAKHLEIKRYEAISNSFNKLKQEKPGQFTKQLQQATELLSEACTQYKDEIRTLVRNEKTMYINLYITTVFKLKILIIKINDDLFPVGKIVSALENFCNYEIDAISPDSTELTSKIIKSDAIVFTSTNTPEIHHHVKALHSYHKPGIILVPLNGKNEVDRVSLRHGSQLQKAGYLTIFKSFIPIRLFTSIDKEYMKFSLKH